MRIRIDLTAPAHPVVFRPILTRLRARGHEVLVTARGHAPREVVRGAKRGDDPSRALRGLLCFVLWQQGDAAR